MGRRVCIEPQSLYKGALYLTFTYHFFSRMAYCMPNLLKLVSCVLKRTAKTKLGMERQVLELASFLA